jgi:hypothetical protein
MRDDDPLKYFPGYAEACAKAEANNLAPEDEARVRLQRTGYSALTWSAEKPKAAGWWWVKGHKDTSVTAVRFFNEKLVVYIYEINGDCPIDDPRISHWRWAGPLPEPQEPPPVESPDNEKLRDAAQ